MRKDDLISNLTLAWIAGVVDREYAPDIIKQKWYGNYLVNMQVGFWRTDELIKLLRDTENAWQAELYGSIRARKNKDRKFLYLKCLGIYVLYPICAKAFSIFSLFSVVPICIISLS